MGLYGVIQGMKVVTLAVFWGGYPAKSMWFSVPKMDLKNAPRFLAISSGARVEQAAYNRRFAQALNAANVLGCASIPLSIISCSDQP